MRDDDSELGFEVEIAFEVEDFESKVEDFESKESKEDEKPAVQERLLDLVRENIPVPDNLLEAYDDNKLDTVYYVSIVNNLYFYTDAIFLYAEDFAPHADVDLYLAHASALLTWATWLYEGLHEKTISNEEFRDSYQLYKRSAVLYSEILTPYVGHDGNEEEKRKEEEEEKKTKEEEEEKQDTGPNNKKKKDKKKNSKKKKEKTEKTDKTDKKEEKTKRYPLKRISSHLSNDLIPCAKKVQDRLSIAMQEDEVVISQEQVRLAVSKWAEALDGMMSVKRLCLAVDLHDGSNERLMALTYRFMDVFVQIGLQDGGLSLRPLVALALTPNHEVHMAATKHVEHLAKHATGELKKQALANMEQVRSLWSMEAMNLEAWCKNILSSMKGKAKDAFKRAKLPTKLITQNWDVLRGIVKFEYDVNLPMNFHKAALSDSKALKRRRYTTSRVLQHKLDRAESLMNSAIMETLLITKDPKHEFSSWSGIGNGAFGEVYSAKRVRKQKGKCEMVAIKTIPDSEMRVVKREILSMSSVRHDNLISYEESYYLKAKKKISVVMELCDGGSLQEMIRVNKMKEPEICYICREVLQGLAYLDRKFLIHRDIKSENIFLHLSGQVKIGDLGLCVQYDEEKIKSSLAGTAYYMSPEMVRHEGYTPKADIWSFGCMLIEMCMGRPPRYGKRTFETLVEIATSPIPSELNQADNFKGHSDELLAFARTVLNPDQAQRPSAKELLLHPWLKRASKKEGVVKLFRHVFTHRALQDAGLF